MEILVFFGIVLRFIGGIAINNFFYNKKKRKGTEGIICITSS
jgi:hypothetical protein